MLRRLTTGIFILALPACRPRPAKPAWQWSLDSVRQVVTAVRAGRSLKPASWPNGARVAVLLSFDVDNETIPLAGGSPTIGNLSEGEYGSRVGLHRVLEQLDRLEVPATFFIPAVSLLLAPDMAALIKRSGRHEFAVHGWIHESSPAPGSQRELIQRATDSLSRLTGSRPVGYRAPAWNPSASTLSIIQDMGFLYESSLMGDDDPYELLIGGRPSGLVELPVSWNLDDLALLQRKSENYSAPREVLQVWIDEFDRAYAEGGMFLVTMHPHVIGRRSGMVLLEQLLDHIRRKPGVWFATHRAAAEYVKRASPPRDTRRRSSTR